MVLYPRSRRSFRITDDVMHASISETNSFEILEDKPLCPLTGS
ncbi:MAG: hypothetical protein OES14_05990 [Nitrosopumilus sp.]|nr:hypothetical protein [Nitrosopumilus sp.]